MPLHFSRTGWLLAACLLCCVCVSPCQADDPGPADAQKTPLQLTWEKNLLTISAPHVPGEKIEIWYLEAYCRPGSTDRDWQQTVIGHETRLLSRNAAGTELKLRCTLSDGVIVEHQITSTHDAVTFALQAQNPTDTPSLAHWAQPCLRVGAFTGHATGEDKYAYLGNCFVFMKGQLQRLPTTPWATQARYVPGQVWSAPGVPRDDVNPRPLNPEIPSLGLIGCFSADDRWLLATAWEPYQELFQGIIRCIHSDFRIGGLQPGESKTIRGKLYVVPNDLPALLERYRTDFPEHHPAEPPLNPASSSGSTRDE